MLAKGSDEARTRVDPAMAVTLWPWRRADRHVMRCCARLLLLASFLGLASRAAAEPPVSPAFGLHDRIDLGLRTVDVALDVASPGAASEAVTGQGRVETELVLGTRLALVQPYHVAVAGARLGAPRIEARRSIELGARTLASVDLAAERESAGTASRASTRLVHRFTSLVRGEVSVDVGEAPGGARRFGGALRLERRF